MKRLLSTIETIAAAFLLVMALLIAGNVLLRNLAGLQIPDWFDGVRLLLGIAMFWGVSIATYRAGHICVDLLWEHLGPAGRVRLDVVASLLTLAFLVPLAWMVWVKVAGTGTQATSDLRLPMAAFYAVAAAGASAAALLALLRAVRLLQGRDPDHDLEEVGHGS